MRIIFSLEIELEPPAGTHSAFVIVPLDRAGQGVHTKAAPPKRRVVDLRVGDYLIHRGERRKVLGIKAYRDCICNDGYPLRCASAPSGNARCVTITQARPKASNSDLALATDGTLARLAGRTCERIGMIIADKFRWNA